MGESISKAFPPFVMVVEVVSVVLSTLSCVIVVTELSVEVATDVVPLLTPVVVVVVFVGVVTLGWVVSGSIIVLSFPQENKSRLMGSRKRDNRFFMTGRI